MPSGGIDLSAAIKAFMVTIISLCFMAQYCALMRSCDEGVLPYGSYNSNTTSYTSVDIGECRVPSSDVGLTTSDDGSAWAMGFAIVYAAICGISFLGCAMIMCKADGCAKVYALGLVTCMGVLTLFDYWYLIAIHNTGNDNGINSDVINYNTFKVATSWFMELAIYLNAAADAWITNDEEQVDKDVLTR